MQVYCLLLVSVYHSNNARCVSCILIFTGRGNRAFYHSNVYHAYYYILEKKKCVFLKQLSSCCKFKVYF